MMPPPVYCASSLPTVKIGRVPKYGDYIDELQCRLAGTFRDKLPISKKVRKKIQSLELAKRRQVVDHHCFALRESAHLKDVDFVVTECGATIMSGGIYCAFCAAVRSGDLSRVRLYLEYLRRGYGTPELLRQNEERLLTQIFVAELIEIPYTDHSEQMADFLLENGANLSLEINGGTLIDWAVRTNMAEWVRYFLLKGGLRPADGTGKDALRLASILAKKGVYRKIFLHTYVTAQKRQEAEDLWHASVIIQKGVPEGDLYTEERWLERCCEIYGFPELFLDSTVQPYRENTNPQVKFIIKTAVFVERLFGCLPAFLSKALLRGSVVNLKAYQATTSDAVDLLLIAIGTLDEYDFSRPDNFGAMLRTLRNDLKLGHLAKLLVISAQRQLKRVEFCKRLQHWCSTCGVLMDLALNNVGNLDDAFDELHGCLEHAAVLTVAVDAWRSRNTDLIEALISGLISRHAFVGLSGLMTHDETAVSAVRPHRTQKIAKLVFETSCCQLNQPELYRDSPKHWNLRSLKCLAAQTLNASLDIAQFATLPDVRIFVQGMVITLPFFVDAHNSGTFKSQRYKRVLEPRCGCQGLMWTHLYDSDH